MKVKEIITHVSEMPVKMRNMSQADHCEFEASRGYRVSQTSLKDRETETEGAPEGEEEEEEQRVCCGGRD